MTDARSSDSPLIKTEDGSHTIRHPHLGETYHAHQGAASEAQSKFILPTRLIKRLQKGPVRLLDIGLGLGINCRAALECANGFEIFIDTVELEPEALDRGLLISPDDPLLLSLKKKRKAPGVNLHLGDLRKILPTVTETYDVIFHDPFSPLKNTEAWTVEVFQLLRDRIHPDGILATYSESNVIRSAFHEAGFRVGASAASPPHRGGTVASLSDSVLEMPLEPAEFWTEPYRDPELRWDAKRIRAEREAVVRSSRTTFVPHTSGTERCAHRVSLSSGADPTPARHRRGYPQS